jgi:hypothetical protein
MEKTGARLGDHIVRILFCIPIACSRGRDMSDHLQQLFDRLMLDTTVEGEIALQKLRKLVGRGDVLVLKRREDDQVSRHIESLNSQIAALKNRVADLRQRLKKIGRAVDLAYIATDKI